MIYFSLIVFSMLLWLANAVYAAAVGNTYYVATNGNNGNSCSQSSPCRTISHGVTRLQPGDTLYVRGGTYNEEVRSFPSGSSWSSPVTIAAYPGETPTVPRFTFHYQSYVVIDGFIVDAGQVWPVGFQLGDSTHIRIKNTEVKNGKLHGLLGGLGHSEFLNLNVHHNGHLNCIIGGESHNPGLCHGIYLPYDDNLIDGGSYHHNGGYGIHIYHSPEANKGAPDRNTVRNVRAYNNNAGSGIGVFWGTDHKVYNNLVYNNAYGGIWVTTVNSVYLNNTVYGNAQFGILANNTGNTFKNNIVYNNAGENIINLSSNTLSNNLTTDPKFVNAAAGDL